MRIGQRQQDRKFELVSKARGNTRTTSELRDTEQPGLRCVARAWSEMSRGTGLANAASHEHICTSARISADAKPCLHVLADFNSVYYSPILHLPIHRRHTLHRYLILLHSSAVSHTAVVRPSASSQIRQDTLGDSPSGSTWPPPRPPTLLNWSVSSL
jgi:hypothetical protein